MLFIHLGSTIINLCAIHTAHNTCIDGNVDAVTFGTGTGGTIAGKCPSRMF